MLEQREAWYASVLRDVAALPPTAVPSLESLFVEIAQDRRAFSSSARWCIVVAIITDVLANSAPYGSSAPRLRLLTFLIENSDLVGSCGWSA